MSNNYQFIEDNTNTFEIQSDLVFETDVQLDTEVELEDNFIEDNFEIPEINDVIIHAEEAQTQNIDLPLFSYIEEYSIHNCQNYNP